MARTPVTGTPQGERSPALFFNRLSPGRRRAIGTSMPSPLRFVLPGLLLSTALNLAAGQEFLREAAETNVNRQYVIESVSVAGVDVDQTAPSKLPKTLRERLRDLVGERCDVAMLEDLSVQIRREMHLRTVTEHLSKGSAPDRIRVNFEVVRRDLFFDISLPKFLFHSKQGFTGEVDASTRVRQNDFTVGVVSNGDDLTERFTGVTARYDSPSFGEIAGIDRVRLGATLEDYHEQWNQATINALPGSGLDLYRSRWNVAPQVTFAATPSLTVAIGTSFEGLGSESANTSTRSANAGTLDVHYGRKIEGTVQQQIDGIYSLRIATRALGSTYSYARHLIRLKYEAQTGRYTISDEFMGGAIAGNAPLFDRFALGNSSTLVGWDRFEIDPLGGTRVVHNQMTYGYRVGAGTVQAFYDAGMVWQPNRAATLRHSVGAGYKQGIFVMAMAFPVRDGRIEPVFMAGMNY
jgi:Omp85 superfamily domain